MFYENEQDEETFLCILALCENITDETLLNNVRRNKRARMISNAIYEMSTIRSGLISKEAIRACLEGRQKKPTEEHYFSRQEGGESIIRYVEQQRKEKLPLDFAHIKQLVDRFRNVHLVSTEENRKLDTFLRKNKNYHGQWEKTYEAVGIELVDYVPRKRFKTYNI